MSRAKREHEARHEALLVDAFDGLDLLVGVAALVGVDCRNRHSSWVVGGSKLSKGKDTGCPNLIRSALERSLMRRAESGALRTSRI